VTHHLDSPGLSERDQVSRAAGVVGFFTLLSRILGLMRDVVVARFFGSGMAADAFFVAFRIPNLLRRLFAEGSLTIAFIPVFSEYLQQKTREDAFQLARAILTLLSLILTGIALLGVLLSRGSYGSRPSDSAGQGPSMILPSFLRELLFPTSFS